MLFHDILSITLIFQIFNCNAFWINKIRSNLPSLHFQFFDQIRLSCLLCTQSLFLNWTSRLSLSKHWTICYIACNIWGYRNWILLCPWQRLAWDLPKNIYNKELQKYLWYPTYFMSPHSLRRLHQFQCIWILELVHFS